MTSRRAVAALLEWERPWPSWRGLPWFGSVVRPLALPRGCAVLGVGGATLGGSGKTPVAIALVHELAQRGFRVAFVAHGYGAKPPIRPRVVSPAAAVAEVGDEALLAACALEGRAAVLVASDRQSAVDAAAELGEVLVVDGMLQSRPERLACALLAVDARAPWGSGRVLPFGDLRAAPSALTASADEVVAVGASEAPVTLSLSAAVPSGWRVALLSSMARPARFHRAAEAAGLAPLFHVKRDDHQPFSRGEAGRLHELANRLRLDAWVLDSKSTVLVPPTALGRPFISLRQAVTLSCALVERVLARLARPSHSDPARRG